MFISEQVSPDSSAAGVLESLSPIGPGARWPRSIREEENRNHPRRSLRCPVRLVRQGADPDDRQVIQGDCRDLGDRGLYAILPGDSQVAVGRRFRFELTLSDREAGLAHSEEVSQEGEVVRVELLLSKENPGYELGVGVRLLGPRRGVLPMPAVI